jgi:hypothetical protein
MAERFNEWPEGLQGRRGPQGSKYDSVDWEQFFDGGVYRITEKDFESPKAFGATFRLRANQAGKAATVVNAFDGERVTGKGAEVNEVWVQVTGDKAKVNRKPKSEAIAEDTEAEDSGEVPAAPAFAG